MFGSTALVIREEVATVIAAAIVHEQEVEPVALSGELEKGSGIETLGLVVGRDDDREVQALHVPPVGLSFQT